MERRKLSSVGNLTYPSRHQDTSKGSDTSANSGLEFTPRFAGLLSLAGTLKRSSATSAYLLSIIFFLATSCQKEKPVNYNDANLIAGNASPILINPDSTNINLEDYVSDLSKIDSIVKLDGLTQNRQGNQLQLKGEMRSTITSLKIWSAGEAYSIPLQKISKKLITLTYSGNGNEVKTKGEFNAWNADNSILKKEGDVFKISLLLNPGNYQYLFLVDGKEKRDPSNKDSVDNGMGGWNSILRITRPDPKKIPTITTQNFTNNTITLSISNPTEELTVYWKNFLLDSRSIKQTDQEVVITIPRQAEKENRSFIRAWAANKEGISNDVLIPLQNGKVVSDAAQLTRQDKEAQVLYFMMIDRFKNGRTENDEPVNDLKINPKANYYGGDIAGVTQKIKDGYFKELGINTIWLSPISQNPKGAYGKYIDPPTTFSGYHGYWPVSLQQIDYRFGNKQELEELIKEAHQQSINVILDYVAHHIHKEHPLFKLKPEWFTPLYLPDGTINTERWDDQRLTTWFDVFMPTLDLRRPEVVGPMTDTAMFWLEKYDLDGFRHDASKHIDLLFWRELTKKVKSKIDRPIYQIGETYGSRELVNSYVNTGMLDAQFDFNVYDDAVNTFARDEVPFTRITNSLAESISWFGDHNLMGNITGNQDRARFISYADGSVRFDEDAKKAGWKRKIEIKDTVAYKKLQSLTAFMMTVPGIPVIYYGDEIGDPGANDPDNRRMMRFENLSRQEKTTRSISEKLVHLRRALLPLTYGDFTWVLIEDEKLIYKRNYFGEEAFVIFNKSSQSQTFDLGELPSSAKANFENSLQFENKRTTLTLNPHSFEIVTFTNR
jgi:cyclomaltodextrinase / maltogenic alpha-amylase / neopullulanase